MATSSSNRSSRETRPLRSVRLSDALSAAISVFNQIDLARPTFDPQDNINGIISEGGTAANIIPSFASCSFCLRADTMKRIEDLIALIRQCVENAERLTGAKGEVSWDDISAERYPSKPICQAFKDNMNELGIEMTWPDPKKQYGSSDIGNVSIKIPVIHDYLSITDDTTIQAHTVEYAKAAGSPEAFEVCLKGAKGLAMTAFDILSSKEFQKEIQEYVKKNTAPYKYPRVVEFVSELPKTISGKIRRVQIRKEDEKQ